jgi:hypothetical protein
MYDPRDTDPRRSDLPRRLDLEGPSNSGSMWAWLAALVVVLAILGITVGYNWTEQAGNNQSNVPTTTGAAPSEPRPPPPAGNTPVTPPAPAPNEGPR